MNTFQLSTSISACVIIPSAANAGFSGSILTQLELRVSHMRDMMANINTRTEREDVVPPGYFLLPFLRCPQSFLFLFALHKVTAISGLSDIHSKLFRGRQRRGPLENGNQSVAGKSFLTDVSGWLLISVSASQCCLLLHTTDKTVIDLNNTHAILKSQNLTNLTGHQDWSLAITSCTSQKITLTDVLQFSAP